jgi:hypothetical protein
LNSDVSKRRYVVSVTVMLTSIRNEHARLFAFPRRPVRVAAAESPHNPQNNRPQGDQNQGDAHRFWKEIH